MFKRIIPVLVAVAMAGPVHAAETDQNAQSAVTTITSRDPQETKLLLETAVEFAERHFGKYSQQAESRRHELTQFEMKFDKPIENDFDASKSLAEIRTLPVDQAISKLVKLLESIQKMDASESSKQETLAHEVFGLLGDDRLAFRAIEPMRQMSHYFWRTNKTLYEQLLEALTTAERKLKYPQLQDDETRLGRAYAEAGDYERAIPLFQDALKNASQTQRITAESSLAIAYLKVGEIDSAKAQTTNFILNFRRDGYWTEPARELVKAFAALGYVDEVLRIQQTELTAGGDADLGSVEMTPVRAAIEEARDVDGINFSVANRLYDNTVDQILRLPMKDVESRGVLLDAITHFVGVNDDAKATQLLTKYFSYLAVSGCGTMAPPTHAPRTRHFEWNYLEEKFNVFEATNNCLVGYNALKEATENLTRSCPEDPWVTARIAVDRFWLAAHSTDRSLAETECARAVRTVLRLLPKANERLRPFLEYVATADERRKDYTALSETLSNLQDLYEPDSSFDYVADRLAEKLADQRLFDKASALRKMVWLDAVDRDGPSSQESGRNMRLYGAYLREMHDKKADYYEKTGRAIEKVWAWHHYVEKIKIDPHAPVDHMVSLASEMDDERIRHPHPGMTVGW